jgi:murein tripeptide amidase MpaA
MFADYQDVQTIWAFLAAIPGVTQISIGKTYLGENMNAFKIGTGSKHIVFHGGIHAREWISPATVTYIAHQLATNPEAAELRNKFTFYVLPVLNVDGYKATRSSSSKRMVRKNMQPNAGTSCVGTDLNRNFAYQW